MSYKSFRKHMEQEEVKASPLFKKWDDNPTYAASKKSSPIELLLLGTLCYFGDGWMLDNLEGSTSISEETHC
eukprot:CAMPEP_0195253032 /NCGR_PEP_ID=MMETSP0706-20130129/4220_1 /TAXON_ID=33640 /ORGANISM="Asterionellopsis glacialis, Strain CCMP134" /LENGTH=71 /DNA_ID=CAMNT_0040305449 /DNA_START=72 /DNA_END=284 /DNA_ORIENTATION=-